MEEINLLCKRADKYLHSARLLIDDEDFDSAVSRTYYAMFYMTQACLFSQNITVATHKGNASKFNELFVKTGIFPKQFSQYLTSAMDKRSKGDYDIFSVIDFDLAQDLLQTAHVFKAALQGYLEENGFCGE